MKIDNKVLTLVNIYAPNKDNPTFSPNLLDHLLSFECEEIIMGGDSKGSQICSDTFLRF